MRQYEALLAEWERAHERIGEAVNDLHLHTFQVVRREDQEKGTRHAESNAYINSRILPALREMPIPVHPSAAILQWVANTDDADTKRFRGIAAALVIKTGWEIPEPLEGYSARGDTRQRIIGSMNLSRR